MLRNRKPRRSPPGGLDSHRPCSTGELLGSVGRLRYTGTVYLFTAYQADVVNSEIAIPQTLDQVLSAAVKGLECASAVRIDSSAIHAFVFGLTGIVPSTIQNWLKRVRETHGLFFSFYLYVKLSLIECSFS